MAWWFSLVDMAYVVHQLDGRDIAHRFWIDAACIVVAGVAAKLAVERTGLLALARDDAQGRSASSRTQLWWHWLKHFRLGLGALVASLALGWWGRVHLLTWLLTPVVSVGPGASGRLEFHFGLNGPPYLPIVVGIAWLPAVPFLASDLWGLLRPLLEPRTIRLQIPFALSSMLVTAVTVLVVRQQAPLLFGLLASLE